MILSLEDSRCAGAGVMPGVGRISCRSDEHSEKRSDAMHILEHLFLVGEFPARAHLLSGLTLEQVTLCPFQRAIPGRAARRRNGCGSAGPTTARPAMVQGSHEAMRAI